LVTKTSKREKEEGAKKRKTHRNNGWTPAGKARKKRKKELFGKEKDTGPRRRKDKEKICYGGGPPEPEKGTRWGTEAKHMKQTARGKVKEKKSRIQNPRYFKIKVPN